MSPPPFASGLGTGNGGVDEEEFESEVIHVDKVPGLFPIPIQQNAEAEIQTVDSD